MSNKVQCCWLAHRLQLIFLVFLSLWFSTEFPLSTFWFFFNRGDSLLRDQEVAHLSLAYPVTQLDSSLLGHVPSFLWLNPGQGGRPRGHGPEMWWWGEVSDRDRRWDRAMGLRQPPRITCRGRPGSDSLSWLIKVYFPACWLMQKPSKQVLSDSNLPSGVSKWVPNTLHNR